MDYLFAYGVFRDAARYLLGEESIYCGRAFIKGRLWKVNEFYPGYVEDNYGIVWGDIYSFNPDNLPEMDKYEGDEYIRKKVLTSADIKCWVYEYKYDVSKFQEILCGDWMLR